MDSVMRSSDKKKTQWNQHMCFAIKLARQKLTEYYNAVPPMTVILLKDGHIINPVLIFQSVLMLDK